MPQSLPPDPQITDSEYELHLGNRMRIWMAFPGMSAGALETDGKA